MGKKKLTYEFVEEQFNNDNYKLLSGSYVNCRTKLKYRCPKDHKHSITWKNWQQGNRCFYCNIINRSNRDRLDINFIRYRFEKEKCQLLTTKYVNDDQKLDYICPNGHKHSITWNNWVRGRRCKTCYRINISGSGNPSWKDGISCEPYCFEWSSKEFKNFIKQRDDFKCLNPDCWENIHRLCIHHIDYNKKNCEPENLITLCRSCNSRANKDRGWHKAWYETIIYRRYYSDYGLFK